MVDPVGIRSHFFRQRGPAGFRGFKLRVKLTATAVFQVGSIPSKIEWDLTNGPLSKLRSSC